MVKNFRVVVMMEHVRGPKLATVMKMKFYNETRKTCELVREYCKTTAVFFNPLKHINDGFGQVSSFHNWFKLLIFLSCTLQHLHDFLRHTA